MTKTTRFLISLPDPVLKRVTRHAKLLDKDRTTLIHEIILDYMTSEQMKQAEAEAMKERAALREQGLA